MAPILRVLAFLLILFVRIGVKAADCMPTSCSRDGPIVRFPFRIKSRQPRYCGYDPSFDLYCNERDETAFELPSLKMFSVDHIDCSSQTIKLHSNTDQCYPQYYKSYLKLSASPFHPTTENPSIDFVLFNCSATEFQLSIYSLCLNESSYGIYMPFPMMDALILLFLSLVPNSIKFRPYTLQFLSRRKIYFEVVWTSLWQLWISRENMQLEKLHRKQAITV